MSALGLRKVFARLKKLKTLIPDRSSPLIELASVQVLIVKHFLFWIFESLYRIASI